MVKNKLNNISREYLDREYIMATNKRQDDIAFKCANCGRDIKIKYDEDNNPVSLWCDKCRELEFKIKKKFKMENGSDNIKNKKDPYIALAQMKILMGKTKQFWKKGHPFGYGLNIKKDILTEIDDILKKTKVPEKYMIAESLD